MMLASTSRPSVRTVLKHTSTSTTARRSIHRINQQQHKLFSVLASSANSTPYLNGNNPAKKGHKVTANHRPTSILARNFSAPIANEADDAETHLTGNVEGYQAAAAAGGGGGKLKTSHQEAWMINLGRANDNEWLTGPRSEDWYTGLPPSKCPGKLNTSCGT